ncbi:Rieske 2Fe-2S domain-containing protein [Achromobacter aegrifaciens]|uniref:Rieske 2Fe-2S domain-containing protein n=1 Tax=Achromobacter aegrifaciens TaxID=1287736 RepID=UPI0009E8FCAD
MARKFICQVADVPDGGMKTFDLEGQRRILLLSSDSSIYACQSVCPHQDVCLDEGLFDGQLLTCHQHLWQWDVSTGDPVGLAEAPLETYKVEIEEGRVYIEE